MVRTKPLDPSLCIQLVHSSLWAERTERDESGCVVWIGAISSSGYGSIRWRMLSRAGAVSPHRIALVAALGRDLLPGMDVDHLCRVRACVNPQHLEEVTRGVNVARGLGARRTHCIHGHPFDEENTYIRPDIGTQQCKACSRERTRRAGAA